MAKAIHTMIRIWDEAASVDFYHRAFGLDIAERLDFGGFALLYLRNDEVDFELELTVNEGQNEAYTHGTGYGHLAVCVDDLDREHARFVVENLSPGDIKEFSPNGSLLARFFSFRIRTDIR